jgi:peptidoglycan/LPS O-acetylase OafA/YrhL
MKPIPPRKPGEGRLRELDGWRAISVLLVIAHHLGKFQFHDLVAHHVRLATLCDDCGPLGVKIFFVISGFVICRLLLIEERRYGAVSLKGFYLRRVFRILPPFYFYLGAVSLLIAAQLIPGRWEGIATSGIFLYDLIPAMRGNWFVGHSWSLAVEEQFYLTFPAIWLLSRRSVGRKPAVIAMYLAVLGWNLSSAVLHRNYLTPFSIRAGFACISFGIIMATFEDRFRAMARSIPSAIVAVIGFSVLWHPAEHYNWVSSLYECAYMPMSIALVLAYSLERGNLLREFLCSKPIQAIGITSYGIYLWQELFTAPLEYYTHSGRFIGYLLPALFVVVPLSWFLIEGPSVQLGKALSARLRPRGARREVAVQAKPVLELP